MLKIGSSAETVGVVFATEEGTAESGVDYDPLHGVLTFSPSETEKEIAISINDDGLIEGQEYFSVILSLPMSLDDGVITSQERVRVTIEDNDSEFTFDEFMIRPHSMSFLYVSGCGGV